MDRSAGRSGLLSLAGSLKHQSLAGGSVAADHPHPAPAEEHLELLPCGETVREASPGDVRDLLRPVPRIGIEPPE